MCFFLFKTIHLVTLSLGEADCTQAGTLAAFLPTFLLVLFLRLILHKLKEIAWFMGPYTFLTFVLHKKVNYNLFSSSPHEK